MEEIAREVSETLQDRVGEANLVGVSYYDKEGVGHVYRSAWAEEKYEPEQVDAIVEELRFDSLHHEVYESQQSEELRATVRCYEEMLDIAVPANEHHGMVFALDTTGAYDLRRVINTVEDVLATISIDEST